MSEVEDHVPEQTGTVKSTVQRFFIVIGTIVTLAFIVGIYYSITSSALTMNMAIWKGTAVW